MDKKVVSSFQKRILRWYKQHQRDLPWRKTANPYHILVSEVMLQQTQVSRVIPKYTAWIERFPTLETLAKAPLSDILQYWSGLGYNRRALNLQKAAKIIVDKYNGIFPQDISTLRSLPGIGEYTASALLSFAFKQPVPVVDTNIRKVIAVEFFDGILPDEKTILRVAEEILPQENAYDWNQALMDYSRLVLKEKKIPVPKQSHFLSSNRFIRGQIIQMVVEKQQATYNDIQKRLETKGRKVEPSLLEKIVKGLEEEGFIRVQGNTVIFSS